MIWSVFKDGGKKDKKKNPTSSSVKCYFIRLRSDALVDRMEPYILSNRTIGETRSLFMHAHTLANAANYMARYVSSSKFPSESCIKHLTTLYLNCLELDSGFR